MYVILSKTPTTPNLLLRKQTLSVRSPSIYPIVEPRLSHWTGLISADSSNPNSSSPSTSVPCFGLRLTFTVPGYRHHSRVQGFSSLVRPHRYPVPFYLPLVGRSVLRDSVVGDEGRPGPTSGTYKADEVVIGQDPRHIPSGSVLDPLSPLTSSSPI